jgi:D-alanyl-D-alanine endopeptidase (penicillin-binding protein 7)
VVLLSPRFGWHETARRISSIRDRYLRGWPAQLGRRRIGGWPPGKEAGPQDSACVTEQTEFHKSQADRANRQTTKSGSTRTSVARARSAARAKAAAAARQQREASSPRFKRDALGNLVPDVRAAAAIVFNPQTGEVLWEENSHETRSIASLTKIMTAVTFVADDPDMNQQVLITRADTANASVTHLRTGDLVTWGDLLHLTLIASDNAAARALARTAEGGTTAFVGRMNDMARQLGLTNTHYLDPSGLVAANVSSAYDMSHLIAFAATDPRIGSVMRTAEYVVRTPRREIPIHSTNKLLSTDIDVRGGKTGFISKAGYCLATLLQIPQGSQVAVVVLGAANSATRFWEARHLFNWVVGKAQGIIGTDDARPAPAAASIR